MAHGNRLFGERSRHAQALLGVFVCLELLIWLGVLNDYWTLTMMTMGINIMLAVSLNLINGFTGQFSLGHAGFMAVGGYTAAVVSLKWAPGLIKVGVIPALENVTLSFPLLPPMFLPFAKAILPGGIVLLVSLVLGGLLAALMGLLIGLPTLRLRGDYLAIATLGFGEIIRLSILNVEYLGGATGMPSIPQYATVLSTFVITVLTILCISNIIRSTHGRAMMAIREDEVAAETMGINTTRYKVIAFIIGAFFAGVAGAVYAHTYYLVNPKSFSFMKTIDVLVMVVMGGQGSIGGSIAGAALFTVINTFLSSFPTLRMIIFSAFLVAVMIFLPRGLLTVKNLIGPRRNVPSDFESERLNTHV